jgi:hypothetical protein
MSTGHVVAGILTYVAINLFSGVLILGAANGGGHPPVITSAALVLALIAFGGAALLAAGGPAAMESVTSSVTVGFGTGLNPVMYERSS